MMGVRNVDNYLAARRRKGLGRRRKMKGRGFMDFIGKVGSFLKKHKIISNVGNIVGKLAPGKIGQIARTVGSAAGAMGYGRRRTVRRGAGLRLAGA